MTVEFEYHTCQKLLKSVDQCQSYKVIFSSQCSYC